ncbi:aldehyde dehydrogenase family protein [Conexibacter sp. SYSU D00693]|uniref:aldehyde dehydrogenase family protein n=1 Tax=Conexibacter sp. SYSU D00693 TaxID=2812560 RepID=UPI001F11F893|nr:aldehyde dehydrogenase family protein [Conexibacter sp. SYSU D00693]
MTAASMTISGEPASSNGALDVVDPATGAVFAQAPSCSGEQLDEAMAGAAAAFAGWRGDDDARRRALARAAAAVEQAAPDLASLLTAEQGKPLAEAHREVAGCTRWLRYFAELDVEDEVIQDDGLAHVAVLRRPVGVVAAITPWNFPLLLAVWKVAPALRAGNTVVLKPSPYTPLATLHLGELLAGVLPAGVLNVLSGGDDLGRWMVEHPQPRKVSFTGSVAAGRSVAAGAARHLKRVTLELGGNDAAVVLDDVDVAQVAERLFWAAFLNNGQVCSAVKRVYAPRSRCAELVDALAERARRARVGPGADPGSELGPLNNEPQLRRVEELVSDARRRGGRIAAGGRRIERPGFFHEPTVVTDLDDDARLVAEEQFGPALPVLAYRRVEEAVERANATPFGLAGSVWTSDPDRGSEVAAALDCGTAWVNTHLALAPHQPFGGRRGSGIGVENGPWGLAEFTELQVLHRARAVA